MPFSARSAILKRDTKASKKRMDGNDTGGNPRLFGTNLRGELRDADYKGNEGVSLKRRAENQMRDWDCEMDRIESRETLPEERVADTVRYLKML